MSSDEALQARLAELREMVQRELEASLGDLDGADGPAPGQMVEAMRYAVLDGGKRMRPALAVAACQAVGGRAQDALPVACALELIHAYSLVHDDLPCMDDDDMRRGKPSVHVAYGQARAVLTGDALLTEAFRLLTRRGELPVERRLRLVGLVAEAAGVAGMVGGQELDTAAEGQRLSVEALLQMHAMKTGALFRAAVVGGGISAGADEAQIAALDRYGRLFGAAFQLTDDLLDFHEAAPEGGDSTGDPHEDAVNLAVRLGPGECQARATEAVAGAVAVAESFGEAGHVLTGLVRLIERRRS